jgi:hypothetical protein
MLSFPQNGFIGMIHRSTILVVKVADIAKHLDWTQK